MKKKRTKERFYYYHLVLAGCSGGVWIGGLPKDSPREGWIVMTTPMGVPTFQIEKSKVTRITKRKYDQILGEVLGDPANFKLQSTEQVFTPAMNVNHYN